MLGITVIGAGYVGLVTSVGLAQRGHTVTVVEVSERRLEPMRQGVVPIHEAGLQEGFTAAVDAGRLMVAREAPASADLLFLCVGTPINDRGHADLAALTGALRDLRPQIDTGAAIIIRSTMPLGTTDRVVREDGLPESRTFTNPEFLRQGSALGDFLAPSRVVVGTGRSPDSELLERLRTIFEPFAAPIHVVGYADAEAIKNASNAFLALKLSFANEIAALCECYGADADTVLQAVGADPRIGPLFLRPSFGFGGSCLPKELQTVAMAGLERGLEMHVTVAAAEANLAHQDRFAARLERRLAANTGTRVALLGLAFKAGTDDTRTSPALRVVRRLLAAGYEVSAFDPAVRQVAVSEAPGLRVSESAAAAVAGADLVAITTEWPEFRDLDWAALLRSMRKPIVVDGRRLLDPAAMRAVGADYERIGSAPPPLAGPESAPGPIGR